MRRPWHRQLSTPSATNAIDPAITSLRKWVVLVVILVGVFGECSAYAGDVPLGGITDAITPFSVPYPIQFSTLNWSAGFTNGSAWVGYLAFYTDPNGKNIIATSTPIGLPAYGCNGDCGSLSFASPISFAPNTTYYGQFIKTFGFVGEAAQFTIGLHPSGIGYVGNNPPYDANSVFYDTSDIKLRPQVLIVPGILGTKMSVANKSDCFGYPPACVAWLSDAQIFYGGLSTFFGLPTNSSYFSALRYNANGNPTVPLVLNDLLNFLPDPTVPDLNHDELDCNQSPLIVFGGCPPWGQYINVYNPLRDRLQQAGLFVTTFPYDWRRDLPSLSNDLYHAVQQLALPPQQQQRQVALVAHSMGGLLVSEMLNRHPDVASLLSNIVTLGTPFEGAVDAYLELEGWKSLQEKFLTTTATQDIGKYWNSPYFLLPQQAFVKDATGILVPNQSIYQGAFMPTLFPSLARQPVVPVTYLGATAGKALAIIGSGFLTTTFIQVLNSVQTSGSTIPLLTACRDYQAGNGDGSVSITSAASTSSGITQQLFVQEEHALLPSNPVVLDAITRFLQTGIPPAPTASLRTQPFPPPIFWDSTICSPADLSARASGGQIVANGLIQVTGAHYISSPHGTQITVPNTDQYDLRIRGTGVGTFTLIVTEKDGNNAVVQDAIFANIPVAPTTTGSLLLTPTGLGTLQLVIGGTTTTIAPGMSLTAAQAVQLLASIISTLRLATEITTSLLAKLAEVSRALSRNNSNAAAGALAAFQKELREQTGKHVTRELAAGLLSITNTIAGLLPSDGRH